MHCFSNSLTQNFSEGRAWEVVVNTFPQVILNHGMTGSLEPAHWFSLAPTESRPWSLLKRFHPPRPKEPPLPPSPAQMNLGHGTSNSHVQRRPRALWGRACCRPSRWLTI